MVRRYEAVRKCKAKSTRTGNPCKRGAIAGGFVCRFHGGSAPQVKAKAAQRVKDMLMEALDPDRSLREMARVAFSNIQDLYDENGKLRPIKDWPEDAARAVKSVETVRGNVDEGDGKYDAVLRVVLWDKPKTLDSALKKHGHLTEKVDVTLTGLDAAIEAAMNAGRERLAKARGK